LAWYHWIAGYLIIASGITFTIIPDKPWWLWLSIFAVGGIGFLMVFLPHKEDKYVDKEG
jgi:lipoprotein signal peptidase